MFQINMAMGKLFQAMYLAQVGISITPNFL